MKIKCSACDKMIERTHNRQKYCSQCAYEKQLEAKRRSQKKWRMLNPEKDRQRKRAYHEANPDYWKNYYWKRRKDPKFLEMHSKWNKKYRIKIKNAVFEHYGNKCDCCGESHSEFLSIDHISGGGVKHRKSFKGKYRSINEFLYFNKFPPGYRILCHNCNMAIGFYGYCPHSKT